MAVTTFAEAPSGPYPPSGWKPAGQRLQLPPRQTAKQVYGPPPSEYGPPTPDYGAPPTPDYGPPQSPESPPAPPTETIPTEPAPEQPEVSDSVFKFIDISLMQALGWSSG